LATFAVTTERGPNWDPEVGVREQRGWDEHAQFADDLVDRGAVVLGGPIASDSPDDVALMAFEAADEGAVHSIFSRDPWLVSGVLRIKSVRAWTWWLDSRPQR
jgi:hypothetical protein